MFWLKFTFNQNNLPGKYMFVEYLENIPNEIPGNIPKKCSRNIEYRNIP